VTARAPDLRRYIDRRSFNLVNDLHYATGSIADVLRDIPSIQVDLEGNVSIRANSDVTILVDGQPSAEFTGSTRANVLRQLPANQFERVEVMTNPSAAYSPQGTGGIINLITKQSRHAKPTGQISASGATSGQVSVTASGTMTPSTNLSLSGSIGHRHAPSYSRQASSEQISDPASGTSAIVMASSDNRTSSTFWSANLAGTYDPSKSTQLTAALAYVYNRSVADLANTYSSSVNTGPLSTTYQSKELSSDTTALLSGSATYRREFGGDDHFLLASVSYSKLSVDADNTQSFLFAAPVSSTRFQDLRSSTVTNTLNTKVEYKKEMPARARLDFGYDFSLDSVGISSAGALGTTPSDALPVLALTDKFRGSQAVHGLFSTYEQPLGRLGVMPGLRIEDVVVGTRQLLANISSNVSYWRIYPSLHLSYKLNTDWQLTASYSRRVQRPSLAELNPYRVYITPVSFSQGSMALRPSVTNSYELGWEYSRKESYYSTTIYYRDSLDLIEGVTENIGGGALLSTVTNVGRSQDLGTELVASDHLSKSWSFSFTGDVLWSQITDADVGFAPRSGTRAFASMKVNWSPTVSDFLQASAYISGRRLTAQGATGGFTLFDLGYRHKFGDRLALEIIVIDPFNWAHASTFIRTPTVTENIESHSRVRAISIGLTYALGSQGKAASADFDYR
jgi:outer membrane receptor protein involved in Fe transport